MDIYRDFEINHGGILKIVIQEANLQRDVETFGKMDPYVIAEWEQDGQA
jgi:uncharacterized protein YciI